MVSESGMYAALEAATAEVLPPYRAQHAAANAEAGGAVLRVSFGPALPLADEPDIEPSLPRAAPTP